MFSYINLDYMKKEEITCVFSINLLVKYSMLVTGSFCEYSMLVTGGYNKRSRNYSVS